MASGKDEDYYAILGVPSTATKEEIARTYRKKSLAVHPDRYKGPDPDGALRDFLAYTRAKEVLDDDKARAAFDAVIRAREVRRLKQEAQGAGRKKLREDLEAREEAAKRQRAEPSPAAVERAREQQEAAARAELQREIERLRRSGRLDGAAPSAAPKPAVGQTAPRPQPVACITLSVRWPAGTQHTAESLREILERAGAPAELALALGSSRAMLQLPREEDVAALLARSAELEARGLQLRRTDGAAAPAASSPATAAPASARSGGGADDLPAGWRVELDQRGKPYYYHVKTRKTQWSRPEAGGDAPLVSAARPSDESFETLTMRRLRQAGERQRLMNEPN